MALKSGFLVALCAIYFSGSAFAADAVLIDQGKKVTLHYTLKVDGQVIESTKSGQPIEFVYGGGKALPGIEKNIKGLKAGDHKDIKLEPGEAFGPVNPQAVTEVPKDRFKDEIKVGGMYTIHDKQGQLMRAMVKEVRPNTVLMDFNHPFAGKPVEFDVEIVSVS